MIQDKLEQIVIANSLAHQTKMRVEISFAENISLKDQLQMQRYKHPSVENIDIRQCDLKLSSWFHQLRRVNI